MAATLTQAGRGSRRRSSNRWIGVGLTALLIVAGTAEVVTVRTAYGVRVADGTAAYDPVEFAEASIGRTVNYEAVVPAMCYTKTDGVSNACYACHVASVWPNQMDDFALQEEYAFSDFALTNRWSNLFEDRSAAIAAIGDAEALAYVREDNYAALREALTAHTSYPGYVPDLDFDQGFDELGFARDGSGWRALRYKPFLGTFWPTNGSADDVFIRLPEEFRTAGDGRPSTAVYRVNLSILEAAMTGDPALPVADWVRLTEPLEERAAGIDLDGDGAVGGVTMLMRGLPTHFVGAADTVPVTHSRYPAGVEFLHTVRYLDPDRPGFIARRMKEVRYSRKVRFLDTWAIGRAYEEELNEKAEGVLPKFAGSPRVGLRNGFGWQLQGFIEDPAGRLRLQTEEEHRWCMGCHGTLGVTVDATFTLTRKVPGLAGWAYQNPHGIPDVPQAGADTPEYALYLQRVRGGDEFRANRRDGGALHHRRRHRHRARGARRARRRGRHHRPDPAVPRTGHPARQGVPGAGAEPWGGRIRRRARHGAGAAAERPPAHRKRLDRPGANRQGVSRRDAPSRLEPARLELAARRRLTPARERRVPHGPASGAVSGDGDVHAVAGLLVVIQHDLARLAGDQRISNPPDVDAVLAEERGMREFEQRQQHERAAQRYGQIGDGAVAALHGEANLTHGVGCAGSARGVRTTSLRRFPIESAESDEQTRAVLDGNRGLPDHAQDFQRFAAQRLYADLAKRQQQSCPVPRGEATFLDHAQHLVPAFALCHCVSLADCSALRPVGRIRQARS